MMILSIRDGKREERGIVAMAFGWDWMGGLYDVYVWFYEYLFILMRV